MSNSGSILFLSAAALREAHAALLGQRREQGESEELFAAAAEFIRRGAATGGVIDDDAERRAAQSLLDFWANLLYRAGHEPPEATLDSFDPQLAPQLPDQICPFLGLDAFREQDAGRFFGRQRLIAELVSRLASQQLLAVVGPSGSGKSSLVRAGLTPALRGGAVPGSAAWHYPEPIVPGSDPLAALATAFRPQRAPLPAWVAMQRRHFHAGPTNLRLLADTLSRLPTLLVVDQFEELFTLCRTEADRRAFIQALIDFAGPDSPHRVILTMRSDFEAYVSRVPELYELFERGRIQVTPLSAAELREAIEQPAAQVGLRFESGLVDLLLSDILGEPAALPLLQFTLLKLWERRERNRVTLEAYRRVGGGRLALARSADAFFEALIPEEQVTARRILLRMVWPAEGLEVTSSRVRHAELFRSGEDPGRVARVLEKLVQARLVRLTTGDTPDDAQVEVAHEALVRNWPTLVEWLEQERETLRRRQRLTAAAAEWQALGRDSGALLRGAALAEVAGYADLGELEQAFVEASHAEQQRLEQERAAAHKRELKQARDLAAEQARSARRLRAFLLATAAALLAALTAAGFALRAQISADQNARAAQGLQATAEIARATAETLQAEADQRAVQDRAAKLATLAQSNAYGGSALLYASESISLTLARSEFAAPAALNILMSPYDQGGKLIGWFTDGESYSAAAISGNGRRLLSWSESGVLLWDIAEDGLRGPLLLRERGLPSLVDVQITPNGQRIVGLSRFGELLVWDVTAIDAPPRLRTLDNIDTEDSPIPNQPLALSASGQQLALINSGGLELIDLAAPDLQAGRRPLAWIDQELTAVAISPDGRWLAAGGRDNVARLWDLRALDQPPRFLGDQSAPGLAEQPRTGVTRLALSGNGQRLAVGSSDGGILIWELEQPDAAPLRMPGKPADPASGSGIAIAQLQWSDDGAWLLSQGQEYHLWEIGTATSVLQASPYGTIFQFSGDSRWLFNCGGGGCARYDLAARAASSEYLPLSPLDTSIALAASRDRMLLATHRGQLRSLELPGQPLGALNNHSADLGAVTERLAFTPDGKQLVTLGYSPDDELLLARWSVDGMRLSQVVSGTLGLRGQAPVAAWDPGARWAVSSSTAGELQVWDLQGSGSITMSGTLEELPGRASVLEYSPDGSWLAAAPLVDAGNLGSAPGEVWLWSATAGRPQPGAQRLVAVRPGSLTQLQFNPSGTALAGLTANNELRVWRLMATGWQVAALPDLSADGGVGSLAWSPDGRRLAVGITTARGGQPDLYAPAPIYLMDLAEPEIGQPSLVAVHRGAVTGLVFNTAGDGLISLGADRQAGAHALGSGTPASSWVAYPAPMLLSLQTLSPDGHWLALRDENDYFWLWQYAGNQLADMPVLTFNSPSTPAFSPEGQTLVVASFMSGLVLRYQLADLLSTACELTGRNLSLAEWQQAFGDEPYHRTCPQLPPGPTTAQPIVLEAENLARSGNLEQASERFRAALAINPYLALDPDREPRRLYALVLAEEGRRLARADRVDEAVAQMRQALALAPELDLEPNTPEPESDPEALANQILLDILAERAATALGEERVSDAITALNRILTLDASRLATWLLPDACVLGGLEEPQVAQAALPLCDRLVAIADPTVDFRGARALARMRSGDLAGALQDLRAYRAWMQTNREALGENFQRPHDQAQSWIAALEAGRNPIDVATIARLRKEYLEMGLSP